MVGVFRCLGLHMLGLLDCVVAAPDKLPHGVIFLDYLLRQAAAITTTD